MRNLEKVKYVLCLGLILLGVAPAAHAKVTVQPDFEGTLLITAPDGKVSMIEKGEALPEIASGSKIEIFGGQMTVNTEEGDKLSCVCGVHEGTLAGAATVDVSCQESGSSIKAVKGTITLTDDKGTQRQIAEGSEQVLKGTDDSGETAPETEAGKEIGTEVDPGSPPVDSRSVEASPNQ